MPHENLLKQSIERVWDTLPPVWGKIRGNVRSNAIKEYKITLIQFHVLRHIRRGAHTVAEIAERQQISRPAVSHSVDLLVSKHLITRERDTRDRRYVDLELTPEGSDLLNDAFRKSRNWMGQKMSHLSPEELEIIIQAMAILKKTYE